MLEDDLFKPTLVEKLADYLTATLHLPTQMTRADPAGLPIFISHQYELYYTDIAQRRCLFLITENDTKFTPSQIRKHMDTVTSERSTIPIFVTNQMSSSERARLIQTGTAFVVPGNQLYIPQIALDLREHFRAPRPYHRDKLTPAAQVVLFYLILNPDEDGLAPGKLANVLGYSAMTIGRAFDQLASHNLASVKSYSRHKLIQLNETPRMLMEFSKTLLISPAGKRRFFRWSNARPDLPLAGISALAKYTSISDDETPVYAITKEQFRSLRADPTFEQVQDEYDADACLEQWRYDPHILSDDPIVDPLSLYAQFWDAKDERMSIAAHDLLDRIP